MKKPTKAEYGYSRETGWQDDRDIDLYYNALKAWENRPRNIVSGRQRTRPIHPSWEPVLKHFDPTNPTRSQGAFCRWADLNRGTFSSWQGKQLSDSIEQKINVWFEILRDSEILKSK